MFFIITWTIKIDENIDKMALQLLHELGYTSKAELIRELLREKILDLNLIKHNINFIDRHINAKMDLEEALSELRKLVLSPEKVAEVVNQSRSEIEEVIFSGKEDNT